MFYMDCLFVWLIMPQLYVMSSIVYHLFIWMDLNLMWFGICVFATFGLFVSFCLYLPTFFHINLLNMVIFFSYFLIYNLEDAYQTNTILVTWYYCKFSFSSVSFCFAFKSERNSNINDFSLFSNQIQIKEKRLDQLEN